MKWAITGAGGMLGREAQNVLAARRHHVVPLTRGYVDIRDAAALRAALRGVDVVLNCAAYTAVDAAESAEADAFEVNALGAGMVAAACAQTGARMVHVSTDYVFNGDSDRPYVESDMCAPRSAYGRTKLAGEWAVRAHTGDALIVRTAWLYGEYGACFPATMARLMRERGTVAVVNDQTGSPTWTRDLVTVIVGLVDAHAPEGTYHVSSGGHCTWFEFAREIARSAGLAPEIVTETDSSAFVAAADRPRWSVLGDHGLRAAGVEPIGHWRERWNAAAPRVLA